MSNRGVGAVDTVIPLASKLDVRSEAGDPLDRAAKAIVGLVHPVAIALGKSAGRVVRRVGRPGTASDGPVEAAKLAGRPLTSPFVTRQFSFSSGRPLEAFIAFTVIAASLFNPPQTSVATVRFGCLPK